MSSTQADINQQQQQIPSHPTQQQVQPQYQVRQSNTIYKPPSQLNQVPKQPIFNQKKPELISTTLVTEGSIDPRCNIQKRESLPKNFQYRVTSVEKENLTNIQQNSSQPQQINIRDRSSERYQTIPQSNLITIQQQAVSPMNQFQISNPTQNANSNNQHNQQTQSNNSNYTNQQQNKQLFQQQSYFSSNASIQQKQKTSSQVGTQSPLPAHQKVNYQPQQQQLTQQAQQTQQYVEKVIQQNNPAVIHQGIGQIPINVIQDIVKTELKVALQNLKQEDKIEKALKKIQEFDDKWDQQSLKQLIHVENTQTTNEVYQFISELKDDFTKKLAKIQEQISLNSESCKSNAFAVSQIQGKLLSFNKEYLEVTSKLQEDKKQIQLQFQGIDEGYSTLVKNIAKQIAESETKLKKLLVDESLKIEKQVLILTQEINLVSGKKVGMFQEQKIQNQTNSSPQKNLTIQTQHNKSYDSITQLQPNSTKSTVQSINASMNQNLNEYNSVTRDNMSVDYDQNQNVKLSRNPSQHSEQHHQGSSPYKQDQYNYTNRNSIQNSRRSHTELNTSSTSAQNVYVVSPQGTIPNKSDNYVRKYEDFNKEVDNYLQNRKIPSKIQELLNSSSEIKSQNISDSGYSNNIQQSSVQSVNNSLTSPRSTVINRHLIATSPNSIISPPNFDKVQGKITNETDYNTVNMINSHNTHNQYNTLNINQLQQQDLKKINYQSLQQNRKAFEDYNGASINSSTQISPSRIEQVNLEIDSFSNEIQQSNNKSENRDQRNNFQLIKSTDVISPQKSTENLKFSIIRSQSQNPQLSMISESENEEEELVYQLDDNGFLMDENGNYIFDDKGGQVKLSDNQIEYLRKQNILEE